MPGGYLFIALATILFSTMEIALKLISADFHPMQLNFIRFNRGRSRSSSAGIAHHACQTSKRGTQG